MPAQFILIPGRSSRQGVTLNEGKYTEGYQDETNILRVHPEDMRRLGVAEGEHVRMWNDVGEVSVPCTDAGDECPEGLVFICYGDKSSRLMGGETHGSGMPDSKGLDVFLEAAAGARAVTAEQSEPVARTGDSAPVSARQPPPGTATPTRGKAAAGHSDTETTVAPHAESPHSPSVTTTVLLALTVLALLAFVFYVLPGR